MGCEFISGDLACSWGLRNGSLGNILRADIRPAVCYLDNEGGVLAKVFGTWLGGFSDIPYLYFILSMR